VDYGEGTVLVQMDDWDWYGDARGILDGDKVTVYGEIDDDFYETASIEASSVYVESLGTYFYASSDDEESYEGEHNYWVSYAPVVVGQTTVRGAVTSVMGREFTVDTGRLEEMRDILLIRERILDASLQSAKAIRCKEKVAVDLIEELGILVP